MAEMTRARRITVEIDRLVVDGVSPADAGALRRALMAALQARLRAADPAPSGAAVRRVQIAGAADARGIGHQAGGAVSGALAGKKAT